jgi:hypothetical protein
VLCSEGLSARQGANSDEIQLRIDPVHGDLDEEISGLHSQVRRLKSVKFSNSLAISDQMLPTSGLEFLVLVRDMELVC